MGIPELNRIFKVKRKINISKRASLSLSINAIVVLVLAISMLGLGLAFTKNTFSRFNKSLVAPPPDIPATKGEPIILPNDELEIRHGEEFAFAVNYWNDYADGVVVPLIECSGSLKEFIASSKSTTPLTTSTAYKNPVIVAEQKVSGGLQKPFKFIIPKQATPTTLTGATDVCEIKFCAPAIDSATSKWKTDGSCDSGSDDVDTEVSKQITIRII